MTPSVPGASSRPKMPHSKLPKQVARTCDTRDGQDDLIQVDDQTEKVQMEGTQV